MGTLINYDKDTVKDIFKDLREFANNPPMNESVAMKNYLLYLEIKYGLLDYGPEGEIVRC